MNNREYFEQNILPIMDSVRTHIQDKQKEEIIKATSSLKATLQSATLNPSLSSYLTIDSLKYTGEWNSKNVEDYITMVNEELDKHDIHPNEEQYDMMLDRLIQYEVPKDSAEYVMRKVQRDSIVNLSDEVMKSPLQRAVDEEAERRYAPSKKEKVLATVMTGINDFATLGVGAKGGHIAAKAAGWIGADLVLGKFMDKVTGKVEERQAETESAAVTDDDGQKSDEEEHTHLIAGQTQTQLQTQTQMPSNQPSLQSERYGGTAPDVNGNAVWKQILEKTGMESFNDYKENPGYVMAMLPEYVASTLKDTSPGAMKSNSMISLAIILAGILVHKPLLKFALYALGGASLLSNAGHDMKQTDSRLQSRNQAQGERRYRIYSDEPLNPRITDPVITGSHLLASIDNVPCTVSLTPDIIDAVRCGALPVNKLANTILERSEAARSIAARTYDSQTQEQTHQIRLQ